MGSLLFENLGGYDRQLGKIAAECWFEDVDGVNVSVTLNTDQDGLPLELDV